MTPSFSSISFPSTSSNRPRAMVATAEARSEDTPCGVTASASAVIVAVDAAAAALFLLLLFFEPPPPRPPLVGTGAGIEAGAVALVFFGAGARLLGRFLGGAAATTIAAGRGRWRLTGDGGFTV